MATVSSVLISTFDLHEEAENRYNLDTILLHPLDTHPIEPLLQRVLLPNFIK